MEDEKIIALYFERSEQAIQETDRKYGGYCHSIAMNILTDQEDAEECVSDTYMAAWNTIPPMQKEIISSIFSTIAWVLGPEGMKEIWSQRKSALTV